MENQTGESNNNGSASELMGLLEGTIEQPQVREVVTEKEISSTDAPAIVNTDKSPEVVAEKINDAPISLDDDPASEIEPNKNSGGSDDFESKYKERLTKEFGLDYDTLKSKATAPETKFEYKTELAKLVDEMLPSGMSQKDFFDYIATDYSKLSSIEVLDKKLAVESPELTPEERQYILADRYNLYEDATEQETAIGKYKMAADSKVALSEFESKKASLTKDVFAPKEPQVNQELVQLQQYWKKEAPSVMKSLDKVPVTIKVPNLDDPKKLDEVTIDFAIPNKDKAQIQNWIENQAAATGAKTTEELKSVIVNAFLNQYREKITNNAVQRAISYNNEQWSKKMSNYQPPKGSIPSPQESNRKGSASEFMNLMGIN